MRVGNGLDYAAAPGSTVSIEVFAENYVDLRGYELVVQITGGTAGTLTLSNLYVDQAKTNFAFFGQPTTVGGNLADARAIAALNTGGATSTLPKYVATIQAVLSSDAAGTFTVALLPGGGDTGTLAGDSTRAPMTVNITGETKVVASVGFSMQ